MNKCLLIASAALVSLPGTLRADDLAQTKKQLTATYAYIAKLRKQKDLPGLTRFLKTGTTLDYKVQLRSGQILELKAVLARLPQQIQIPGTIKSFSYQLQSVRRIRNAAAAHVVAVYSGTETSQGKAHRFSGREVWDDVWTKNYKGIWMLKYMVQGPSTLERAAR